MNLNPAIAAAVLVLGLSVPAIAGTITPTDAIQTGNQTSTKQITDFLLGYTEKGKGGQPDIFHPGFLPSGTTELYKANAAGTGQPATEEGLVDSYSYAFAPELDPLDATITYVAGQRFITAPAYALVKDGNHSPAWYLFDLTALGWTGTQTLFFKGFWPAGGAISHVSLYGNGTMVPPPTPDPSPVPDGGSVAVLLGMGLMGLGAARRILP